MLRQLTAILALSLATPTIAETPLKVLNWSDYIDRNVLPEFTAETGITLIYDTYDEGEATEARLLARGSDYDLVVVSSEYLGRLIEAEAIKPLNFDALPSLSRIDPRTVKQLAGFDPTESYTVPYMWGTTGLGYNARAIAERMPDAPVDSWRMIFDPDVVSRFVDCGVAIVDSAEEVFAIALNYLGHDPNSTDVADIAAAEALIREISPFVRSFGIHQKEQLARGEVCLALAWSGDVLDAADEQNEGIDIHYAVPTEGAPVWYDLFVMPADAASPESAYQFLEFILKPDVIARSTNEVWYPNPNTEALAFVDPEIRAHTAVYPPAASRELLFPVRDRPSDKKQELVRSWRMLQLGL